MVANKAFSKLVLALLETIEDEAREGAPPTAFFFIDILVCAQNRFVNSPLERSTFVQLRWDSKVNAPRRNVRKRV